MKPAAHAIIAALVVSGAASFSPAAEIKLDQILAPAEQPEPAEPQAKPAATAEQRLAALLDPGNPRPAAGKLGELDELFVGMGADNPLYTDALALRVGLLGETRRPAEAEKAAVDFLATFSDHPGARRVRGVHAWALSQQGKGAQALEAFRAIAGEENFGLLPEHVVWEGCERLVADGDGATARRLMESVDADRLKPGARSLMDWWMLESLLVSEDAGIDVPAAPAAGAPLRASIQVRRALLLQLRGKTEEAAELRKALEAEPRSLAAAELKALAVVK